MDDSALAAATREPVQQQRSQPNNQKFTDKKLSPKLNKTKCTFCFIPGHTAEICHKRLGTWVPKAERYKSPQTATVADNFMVVEEVLIAEHERTCWFADNGATKHITNDRKLFETYEALTSPHIINTAEHGKGLQAIGKGNVRVTRTTNGKITEAILNNVLFIPNISRNLFSVLQAHDVNPACTFKSTQTDCYLYRSDGSLALQGHRSKNGGLFKLDIHSKPPTTT